MKHYSELIIDPLSKRGLSVKRKRGIGYAFLYDGVEMYFSVCNSEKCHFECRFMVPRIVKVPKRGYYQYLGVVNEMNQMMIGAKFYIYNKSIWSVHEFCLSEEEHLDKCIDYALSVLDSSVLLAKMKTDALYIP